MSHTTIPLVPHAQRRGVVLGALTVATVLAAVLADAGRAPSPDSTDAGAVECDPQCEGEARATASRTAVDRPGASLPSWYAAPVGTVLTFAVEASHHTTLVRRDSGATADGGEWRLTGSMRLAVAQRRAGEAIAEVSFPGVRVAPGGAQGAADPAANAERAQRIESALRQAFLIRVDDEGRVLGYRFPRSFGFHDRGFARMVLAQHCFVVPVAAGSAWTVRAADDTGTFEAEYGWQAGSPAATLGALTRRKTRYVTLAGGAEAGCSVEVDSRATAQLCKATGWLVAAEVDEKLAVSIQAMAVDARTAFRSALRLQAVHHDGTTLPANAFEGAWEGSASNPAEAAAVARQTQLDQWRSKLQGVDFARLLAQLEQMVGSDATGGPEYAAAWEAMSWLCQLDPHAVERAAEAILGGALPPKVAAALLTALGCAGTEQAQQVLAGFLADHRLAGELRDAATVALVQVEKPVAATLAAVLRAATEAPAEGGRLGSTSLLVLGALATRCAEPLADGGTALERLVAFEDESRARGTTDTWLHALGNSGEACAVERAERYFGDANERLREAAAAAVRKVPSDRACDLLVGLVRHDKVDAVRAQAADSLADHGTAKARAALCDLIRRDASVDVRRTAMLGVARRIDDLARAALEHVMCHDPSDELKQLAGELLTGS